MSVDPKTAVYIEKHFTDFPSVHSFLFNIHLEMARGDWSPQRGAVLITRNEETDTLTIVTWGDVDSILADAATLKKADA